MKDFSVVIVVIIMVLLGGAAGYYFYTQTNSEVPANTNKVELQDEIIEEKVELEANNIKIFSGEDRPIAIMIDNNVNAQPQASINKAFVVYEIIVEGNESRLMPVFKGVDDDTILRTCS